MWILDGRKKMLFLALFFWCWLWLFPPRLEPQETPGQDMIVSAENWSRFVLNTRHLEAILSRQKDDLLSLRTTLTGLTTELSKSQASVRNLRDQLQNLSRQLWESGETSRGLQIQLTNLNGLYGSIRTSLEAQQKKTLRLEQERKFYKFGFYIAAGTALASIGTTIIIAAVN